MRRRIGEALVGAGGLLTLASAFAHAFVGWPDEALDRAIG